jgi:tRNA(fMet)-specific endonuclease VapC
VSLYLLDTNVISDMMRNPRGPAAQRALTLSQHAADALICTSVIVDCELLYGLARKPLERLLAAYERTIATLTILPLDNNVAKIYAAMRHGLTSTGQGLDANDTLIAAHALALDATLVSADAAFARVPGLKVENWLNAP